MDVTNQILDQVRIQGGSDNTNPATIGAAKVLNYAIGPSAVQVERYQVSSVPLTVPFTDKAVGLGADNFYVKFKLEVDSPRFACFEPPGWDCARISNSSYDPSSDYEDAIIYELGDNDDDGSCGPSLTCINTYEPAKTPADTFYAQDHARLSVRVVNKGTGNIYVDKNFDVNLMQKSRKPIQEDVLWVTPRDEFYVVFHARDTKRIPYNVDLIIGETVLNEKDIPQPAVLNDWY
jgi:hypothetical protein